MPALDPQKVRPPQYFVALLVLATMFHLALKPAVLFDLRWLGVVVLIAGFTIMFCGKKQFEKNKTPVRHSEKPQALVTEGLYRYTRNPMYVGIEIFLLGLALMIGTWPFLAVPVAMFLILQFIFIPWEEKTMENLFKDEYISYKKSVRRWL